MAGEEERERKNEKFFLENDFFHENISNGGLPTRIKLKIVSAGVRQSANPAVLLATGTIIGTSAV